MACAWMRKVREHVQKQCAAIFLSPHNPLCLHVGSAGMLWVAHWGGGRVSRWDPRTGVCVREVPLPCSLVTSVCFGGPTLSELYITTASRGVDLAREPLAGSLFLLRNPGAPGLPETPFAG